MGFFMRLIYEPLVAKQRDPDNVAYDLCFSAASNRF